MSTAIEAHGGWSAWQALDSVQLGLKAFRGALVFAKGLGRTFMAPKTAIVAPRRRRVEFVYDDHVDSFEDGRITLASANRVIADGRTSFTKTTRERWYPAHAAYFFGYAWANYLGYPFILPTFELLAFVARGDSSCMDIRFPAGFHTHCRVQRFYFDRRRMLARHDYHAEFAGPWVFGAHFTEDYVQHQGLQFAATRKVRPRVGPIVLPMYGIYGEIEFR